MNRLANLDGTKLYKEKFRIWGWQKKTTRQYAQWMIQKANKRKRDDHKETVFYYGGLKWDTSRAQRSAFRSKKASAEMEVIGEYVEKPWCNTETLRTISKRSTHRIRLNIRHREMMKILFRHTIHSRLGAMDTIVRQATYTSNQKTRQLRLKTPPHKIVSLVGRAVQCQE